MHFEEASIGNTGLTDGNLKRSRYIATNRFKVRDNAGAKFEKRWADRKSRLAQLDGFRFFTLLKRTVDSPTTDEGLFGNYISLTVWEDKDSFDAWRTGDAFKEAHGGGGITGFIQLLTTAIFILDGGPKPAFFDGLDPQFNSNHNIHPALEGGWRTVDADGVNFINPDIFMSQYRFRVPQGSEVDFEKACLERTGGLNQHAGFIGNYLMRRDATKADGSFNYIVSTIWKNRDSYQKFQSSGDISTPLSTVLNVVAVPAYYEGKLALVSSKGG